MPKYFSFAHQFKEIYLYNSLIFFNLDKYINRIRCGSFIEICSSLMRSFSAIRPSPINMIALTLKIRAWHAIYQ
jgi:hypothetical protein